MTFCVFIHISPLSTQRPKSERSGTAALRGLTQDDRASAVLQTRLTLSTPNAIVVLRHYLRNYRSSLTRFAWLSIFAAVITIGLKFVSYRLTGSVGLLSDVIEQIWRRWMVLTC